MKLTRIIFYLIAVSLLSFSCEREEPADDEMPQWGPGAPEEPQKPEEKPSEEEESGYPVKYPKEGVPKVKTLQTTGYFKETKIMEGIIHYEFFGKDDVSGAHQNVNVLEVDLNNDDYKINFFRTNRDTTSAVAKKQKAIAAINACYEDDAIYLRVNGNNYSQVKLEPDHIRFWKHEAAIVGDGKRKVGMVYGAKGTSSIREGGIKAIEVYKSLTEKNIYASAPMLIDNYDPVGTRFIPVDYSSSQLKQFESEDYRRHQGGRNPRVAVALTEDNDILFIVVDGRFSGKAEGMSAKELTKFIAKHFNPQWAINMDGGGSSTMYIDGYGDPVNNVLNYPCDNGRWDHYGQRGRPTFFLVQYDK